MNKQNETFWIRPEAVSRRTVLKGAGVMMALPFLNSMAADKTVLTCPNPMVSPVE